MNRDYLKWAALACALVATASAEYELARAVGYNTYVAAAVPGALDVWTVRAMRQHRDVLAAVVAMILVNAASHLVTAGLLPVSVPLVVGVSAIAPLVLYRAHAITSTEQPEAPEYETTVERVPVPEAPEVPPELPAPVPEAVPAGVRLLPIVARPKRTTYELDAFREQWVPSRPPAVPAAEYPRTRPEVRAEYVPDDVPDNEPVISPDPLVGQARQDFSVGATPSVRALRSTYSIGQARAQRIRDELQGASA